MSLFHRHRDILDIFNITNRRHAQLLSEILSLHTKIDKMSTQLDALTAGVAANNSAVESAIALLGNLKKELDAAIAAQPTDDGAALQALSDSLSTEDQKLAAAIVENTPAQ